MRVHSTLRELTDKLKVDLDISFTVHIYKHRP